MIDFDVWTFALGSGNTISALEVKTLAWDSRDLDSMTGSVTDFLGDLGQVILCASVPHQ